MVKRVECAAIGQACHCWRSPSISIVEAYVYLTWLIFIFHDSFKSSTRRVVSCVSCHMTRHARHHACTNAPTPLRTRAKLHTHACTRTCARSNNTCVDTHSLKHTHARRHGTLFMECREGNVSWNVNMECFMECRQGNVRLF